MPCGCKEEEKNKLVKLRFVGGKDKPFAEQGPYHSFEPGKIYEVVARCVDLPFWEAVEEQGSTKVEEEIDFENTDKNIPEDILKGVSAGRITGSEVNERADSAPTKSAGLTRLFTGGPPSQEDFFVAMDMDMLKSFIESNGGRVDGRWGRTRLIEEALKLQ